ncbi:transposase [Pseudidiomarina marina]|uniref:REP-associated tyrosine transposase n=1 Tax=Pseudidiomarina marina TaxID=502366 RepID=UPI00384B98A7
MRNVRRFFERGYYFFTVCTYRRQPILTRPDVIEALRNAVRETMKTHPFEIEAWTVMPDHIHCVLIIKDDFVPVRWGKIKALTTKALPEFSSKSRKNAKNTKARIAHGYGKLWQHSYWEHEIRDEREYMMYILYCCFNPVKHGYVKNAWDWPYSTLNRYLSEGRYPDDWKYITPAWLEDNFSDYQEP